MNFLQLQQRLAIRRNAAASTLVSGTATRYKHALNESHRQVLRKPGRESLRWSVFQFNSAAGQNTYSLQTQGVARVNRITEVTNDRKLEYRTPTWLDEVEPDQSVSGTPWAWIPRGYMEVQTQPSDASTIFVKSTSAADTMVAYIEGYRDTGSYSSQSVTLTGTTAVSFGLGAIVSISKFYLASTPVGAVTLHEDSGIGTELAAIIADTKSQYNTLQLYPTPTATILYYADILRSILDMVNDTDEPLLPTDFHDLLLDMAEMKELRKADDPQRWSMLRDSIKDGESALNSFLVGHPDWRPQFGGEPYEHSTLGAWYPSDFRTG